MAATITGTRTSCRRRPKSAATRAWPRAAGGSRPWAGSLGCTTITRTCTGTPPPGTRSLSSRTRTAPCAKAGSGPAGHAGSSAPGKPLNWPAGRRTFPQVKELFAPTLYFSDTIFAAGLYECFDPNHPTTPADDLRAKQQLCDYLRGQFGLFGSEEGREWGVAHADYFEGLMSHRTHFQRPNDTDIIIPLFETGLWRCHSDLRPPKRPAPARQPRLHSGPHPLCGDAGV